MTACGSCVGDLISTSRTASALLLRHSGLNQAIWLLHWSLLKSALPSSPNVHRGFRLPQSMTSTLLDKSQRGPHIRAGFGPSNFFNELVFSFRSLSCRGEP